MARATSIHEYHNSAQSEIFFFFLRDQLIVLSVHFWLLHG
jgi:hypothetical protein